MTEVKPSLKAVLNKALKHTLGDLGENLCIVVLGRKCAKLVDGRAQVALVKNLHHVTHVLCRCVEEIHLFVVQFKFNDLFDPVLSKFRRNT